MTVVLADSFTGTDGDPWAAANWVDYIEQAPGSSATIQGNRGRLTAAGAAYTRAKIRANVSVADFEFFGTVGWVDALEQYHSIGFRDNEPAAYQESTYLLEFDVLGDSVFLFDQDSAGNDSTLASVGAAGINNLTRRNVRLRVVGSRIQARWWDVGGGEPGTWQIDFSPATSWPTGSIDLYAVNGAGTTARSVEWDDITITDLDGRAPVIRPRPALRFR